MTNDEIRKAIEYECIARLAFVPGIQYLPGHDAASVYANVVPLSIEFIFREIDALRRELSTRDEIIEKMAKLELEKRDATT